MVDDTPPIQGWKIQFVSKEYFFNRFLVIPGLPLVLDMGWTTDGPLRQLCQLGVYGKLAGLFPDSKRASAHGVSYTQMGI